jgi:hypothetical protein
MRRAERFNRLPRQDKLDQVFAGVVRYGPYAMFALLPAYALRLQLVYVGRARRPRLRITRRARTGQGSGQSATSDLLGGAADRQRPRRPRVAKVGDGSERRFRRQSRQNMGK